MSASQGPSKCALTLTFPPLSVPWIDYEAKANLRIDGFILHLMDNRIYKGGQTFKASPTELSCRSEFAAMIDDQ